MIHESILYHAIPTIKYGNNQLFNLYYFLTWLCIYDVMGKHILCIILMYITYHSHILFV